MDPNKPPEYQIHDHALGVVVDGGNYEFIIRRDGALSWHTRTPLMPIQDWPSITLSSHVADVAVASLLSLREAEESSRLWAQAEEERKRVRPDDKPAPLPMSLSGPSKLEPTKQVLSNRTEITIPGQDCQLVLDTLGNLAWRWAPGALDATLNPLTVSAEQQATFSAAVKSAAETINTYLFWMILRRDSIA